MSESGSRVAKPVDVDLALTHAASKLSLLNERLMALDVIKARDAVAGALTECRQLIEDADASGVTAFSKGKGFDESIERARAALAACMVPA